MPNHPAADIRSRADHIRRLALEHDVEVLGHAAAQRVASELLGQTRGRIDDAVLKGVAKQFGALVRSAIHEAEPWRVEARRPEPIEMIYIRSSV